MSLVLPGCQLLWRRSTCLVRALLAQGPLGSSIECVFRDDRRDAHDIKEAICRGRNLALDLRKLQASRPLDMF